MSLPTPCRHVTTSINEHNDYDFQGVPTPCHDTSTCPLPPHLPQNGDEYPTRQGARLQPRRNGRRHHHEGLGWTMNGATIRRRGGYGRNRAQTTRHVVWAQVCFFHILSILLLMFLRFYRFIYYFNTLRYDRGEGMAGTGPKRRDTSFGPRYVFF
jgi:hypothetical protein